MNCFIYLNCSRVVAIIYRYVNKLQVPRISSASNLRMGELQVVYQVQQPVPTQATGI